MSISMNRKLKKIIKKSRIARKIHRYIIEDYKEQKEINFNIDEITMLCGEKGIDNNELRFNIAIPTLKKEFVFGGITTALNFFFQLGQGYDQRIVLTDSDVHEEDVERYDEFKIVPLGKKSKYKKQVVACNDRRFAKLNITENDIFIATSWWSAYILIPLIKWQNETFNVDRKLIYLVQDYEPGFYPWSSRYLLADSTYKSDLDVIAVFNTKLLQDFFHKNDYKFYKEFYFEPVLNEKLYKHLVDGQNVDKKKRMIVYGRPSVDRNCFEIIVGSLKKLLEIYPDANEWEFISMGETHAPIPLNEKTQLVSLGKVSLDDYAITMKEAYIGLSLMVSPHPSYPPLEMSTFGIRTITNNYSNKNLESFNDNIISLDNCSYENVAKQIMIEMKNYPRVNNVEINQTYISNDNLFSNIVSEIINVLNE